MAGHNIHEIHKRGKNKTLSALVKDGYFIIADNSNGIIAEKAGIKYLVNVSVKPYTMYKGERVTGKNIDQLKSIEIKQSISECDDVLFVFYDVKVAGIYGRSKKDLQVPFRFGDCNFPEEAITHSGIIIYWSLYQMETFGTISKEDAEDIARLRYQNKFPKEQKSLF